MAKLIDLEKSGREFKIRNISKTKAEIIIYDEIGESFWGDGVSAKSFTDELNAVPDTVNLIEVRINSPGGDVFEGYTIYNRLKQHKAEIHVYIDGMAASIASLIALAGDKIFMGETSQIMIHKPMVGVAGNSKDLTAMIERLDSIENQLIKAYRNRTGLDYFELQNMIEKETWFMPEDAISNGFADEIVNLGESVRFAASSSMETLLQNATWMKNKPSINYSDNIKEKVNNLTKDIEGFLAR